MSKQKVESSETPRTLQCRCENVFLSDASTCTDTRKLPWPPARWTSAMWIYVVHRSCSGDGFRFNLYPPSPSVLWLRGPIQPTSFLSCGHFTILLLATWSRLLNHVGPVSSRVSSWYRCPPPIPLPSSRWILLSLIRLNPTNNNLCLILFHLLNILKHY